MRHLKAVVAFLAPTLTAVIVQLQKPVINYRDLGVQALSALLTACVVWAVPNKT